MFFYSKEKKNLTFIIKKAEKKPTLRKMSSEPLNNCLRNIIFFKYQLINMKPLKIFLKTFIQKLWKILWNHYYNEKKKIATRKENNVIYFITTISEYLIEYINETTFLCLFFNFLFVFFCWAFFYDLHTTRKTFRKTVCNFHEKHKEKEYRLLNVMKRIWHNACAIILTFLLLLNSPQSFSL